MFAQAHLNTMAYVQYIGLQVFFRFLLIFALLPLTAKAITVCVIKFYSEAMYGFTVYVRFLSANTRGDPKITRIIFFNDLLGFVLLRI